MQRPLLRRIQPKNQLESQVNEFKLQKLAEDIVDFKKETEVKVGNIIEKAESVASGAEEAILEVKSLPSKIKNDFEELTNEIVDALKEIKSEGLKGDKGEDADEEAMEKRLLAKIPEIDIDDIAEKASSLVKPTPASLKIIKESVELKDEEIVPKLNKATNLGDLKLSINNIKDWNNKWEDIKGEISRNKGGYHGGGFNNIANASGTVSTGLDTLKFTGSGVSSVTQTGRTVTVDIAGGGGSGTVTNIATEGLISGGPITTTGTITTSMATGKLVGRSTAGTGIMEEITVGSGLSLSGGTLTATGGTGDVVGPASSTDNAIARFDGTTGKLIQNSSATLSDTGVLTVTDIVTSEVKASGSGGLDILNSSGAQVALFGAGGSTGASLFGTTNIGSSSADYVQITGGTGATTFTATGSSTNVDINITPKGSGFVVVSTKTISPVVIGGTGTTSTLTLQPTSGVGTTGADIIFKVGNNGATEAGRVLNAATFQWGGIASSSRVLTIDNLGRTIQRYDDNSLQYLTTLSNRAITAANQGAGILWQLADTGAAGVNAGSISVLSENTTFAGATADSRMVFATALDGSLTNRMWLTSAGGLSLGSSTNTNSSLRISKLITGGTSAYGVFQDGVVQSDVTIDVAYNRTVLSTAAAAFTVSTAYHYNATQTTLGAGSAITTQIGFNAESSLTGATNNYGFYGAIASGTGRWNVYMPGTARNYFAGDVGIGTTTQVYSEKLAVQNDQNASTYQLIRNNNSGASSASALALNAYGNTW